MCGLDSGRATCDARLRSWLASPRRPAALGLIPLPRLPVAVADPDSNSQQPGLNPLNLVGLVLVAGYLWSQATGLMRGPAGQRQAEISFQEFRNRLLAQGKVMRLEVANNSLVKVRCAHTHTWAWLGAFAVRTHAGQQQQPAGISLHDFSAVVMLYGSVAHSSCHMQY